MFPLSNVKFVNVFSPILVASSLDVGIILNDPEVLFARIDKEAVMEELS